MNESIACLEPEQLKSLLTGDLPPDETAIAETHLSDCDTCRGLIEAQIGGEAFWDDVRHSLTGPSDGVATEASDMNPMSSLLDMLGPSDDPAMLGRIGTYEIAGILGTGGMGVVFKGFDRALNRYVAIKILLPHLAVSGAARKRFAREAQAAAAIVDDHVMAIHCVAQWQDVPYFVMNYSRGVSLQKRLCDEGALELCEILRIAMQSAKGLAAAHAQGLVHRDVKPANIFLDEGVERVQLMDFGLARAADDASLTRSGMLAGTPQFMSPEQTRAEKVDQKSDLFSLGSVMYAMCTGRVPFRAESSYAVLRQITDNDPRPIRQINPNIPHWLCKVIDRLMAKDADDRFESAAEVADLLERCIAHVQQPDEIALPSELVTQPKSSGGGIFGGRAGIAALCSGALIALALVAAAATRPPDISGAWTSEGWGKVTLKMTQDGKYEGDYTNQPQHGPGAISLAWSRIERRFNGQWTATQGEPSGKLSIRLVDDEIRGAWNTRRAENDGSLPRMADLFWKRSSGAAVAPESEGSKSNLSELHKALMAYEADHGTFPPSRVKAEGGPPHSWRVAILPYLGQRSLYDRYRRNEPWDSPHNRSLLTEMPAVFRATQDKANSTNTSYFGMVNARRRVRELNEIEDPEMRYWFQDDNTAVPIGLSLFGISAGVPVRWMIDGTSNIIALTEARYPTPWTQPIDLAFDYDTPATLSEIQSWHPDGWYVAMGDGTVNFIASGTPASELRRRYAICDDGMEGWSLRHHQRHNLSAAMMGDPGYSERSLELDPEDKGTLRSLDMMHYLESAATDAASTGDTKPKASVDNTAGSEVRETLGLMGVPVPDATMKKLSEKMTREFTTGFQITGLIDGTPSVDAGLNVTDILLGIDRWQTGNARDINYVLRALGSKGKSEARFYVLRNEKLFSGTIKIRQEAAKSIAMANAEPTTQPLFQGQRQDVWESRFVNEVDPQAKIEAAVALISMTDTLSDTDKIQKILSVGETIMRGGWLTEERLRVQAFDNALEPSQVNARGWAAASDLTGTIDQWKRLLKISAAKLSGIPVKPLTGELVKSASSRGGGVTAFIVNLLNQATLREVIRGDDEAAEMIARDLKRDDDIWLSRALFIVRTNSTFTGTSRHQQLKTELEAAAKEFETGQTKSQERHASDVGYAEYCLELSAMLCRRGLGELRPANFSQFSNVMLLENPTETLNDLFGHRWYSEREFVYSQVLMSRTKERLGWHFGDWMRWVVERLKAQKDADSLERTNVLIETLQPILPLRDSQDDWDLDAIAALLLERLENDLASDFNDDPVTPIQTHADLLSLILLAGGELPEIARRLPSDPKVNLRLALLKAITERAVDSDHVRREASGIRGLIQVAPFHAVKMILESDRLPKFTSSIELIDTASQVNRNLSYGQDPAPTMDPILLLAILSELTGVSEAQDLRIAELFLVNREESRLFFRHVQDAVESDYAVGDIAVHWLVRMRERTKLEKLRTQINKLLPPTMIQPIQIPNVDTGSAMFSGASLVEHVIDIDKDGKIQLNDQPILLAQLKEAVAREKAKLPKDSMSMKVRADSTVKMHVVSSVLQAVQDGGVTKIEIVKRPGSLDTGDAWTDLFVKSTEDAKSKPSQAKGDGTAEAKAEGEAEPSKSMSEADVEKLLQSVIARCEAIRSGRFEVATRKGFWHEFTESPSLTYHQYVLSGRNWSMQIGNHPGHRRVNFGRTLFALSSPQGAPAPTSLVLKPAESERDFDHGNAPFYAGTLWSAQTLNFIRTRKPKHLGQSKVDGIATEVLEWEIPKGKAFDAVDEVNRITAAGGYLRIYVAPELAYALPRIEFLSFERVLGRRFESRDFKPVANGIFFPMYSADKGFDPDPAYTFEYYFRSVKDVNGEIEDAAFEFPIVKGMSVTDAMIADHTVYGVAKTNLRSAEAHRVTHAPVSGKFEYPGVRVSGVRIEHIDYETGNSGTQCVTDDDGTFDFGYVRPFEIAMIPLIQFEGRELRIDSLRTNVRLRPGKEIRVTPELRAPVTATVNIPKDLEIEADSLRASFELLRPRSSGSLDNDEPSGEQKAYAALTAEAFKPVVIKIDPNKPSISADLRPAQYQLRISGRRSGKGKSNVTLGTATFSVPLDAAIKEAPVEIGRIELK